MPRRPAGQRGSQATGQPGNWAARHQVRCIRQLGSEAAREPGSRDGALGFIDLAANKTREEHSTTGLEDVAMHIQTFNRKTEDRVTTLKHVPKVTVIDYESRPMVPGIA